MVSIELQQLREFKPVISFPHTGKQSLTIHYGLPQNYPIAQAVILECTILAKTKLPIFSWPLSSEIGKKNHTYKLLQEKKKNLNNCQIATSTCSLEKDTIRSFKGEAS